MGIFNSLSDSSDSTAGVSQYLTEGLSSTGYHKFSGRNTLNLSLGIMDVNGDVLAMQWITTITLIGKKI